MQIEEEQKFFKNLSTFKKEYKNLDLDRLILFVIYKLNEKKIETTYDNIVIAAFKLFPEKFSLIGPLKYPDGKRVSDALLHCTYKTKRWLSGNAKSGYAITKKGGYFLEEIKKVFAGKIKFTTKTGVKAKRKEVHFINLLKDSSAYKKFIANQKAGIQENEIWDSLGCDREESIKTLKERFYLHLTYTKKIEDKKVLSFLNYLKKEWSQLL